MTQQPPPPFWAKCTLTAILLTAAAITVIGLLGTPHHEPVPIDPPVITSQSIPSPPEPKADPSQAAAVNATETKTADAIGKMVGEMRPSTFRVGDVGKLGSSGATGFYWRFQVLQVVSDKQLMVVLAGDPDLPFLAEGMSTAGIVDGQEIQLQGLWQITGTRSHHGRTLFVAKLIEP